MAATTTTNPKISLKLLVDIDSNKVLFAEAGKDFIDFLFGLLELPLGTILALEHDIDASGSGSGSGSESLSRVYESVLNLGNDYLQPNQTKDSLLRPRIAASGTDHTPLLMQLACAKQEEVVSQKHQHLTSYSVAFGSSAPAFTVASAPAFCSSSKVQGYVKGVVTYMVMDDLMVKPTSAVSSIALLKNNLKVTDISSLEEKTVKVDMNKGLKLFMKALSKSTTVLTDVFLPVKPL